MRDLLDDVEAFVDSFAHPRSRALRVNPTKIDLEELIDLLDLGVAGQPVPWCADGLLLGSDVRLGGHPAHLAGLFYLQEPSSMAAVEVLGPAPDAIVVDLAAAPGGKSTQLAARCPAGLVVANEVDRGRRRTLHQTLDTWGATNTVTAGTPLPSLVDRGLRVDGALLDAPCTGEGLFRRDPAAIRQWSPGRVEGAARRQAELLAAAAELVRPGGSLLYSTCSFERAENEDRVAELVSESSGRWIIDDAASRVGASPGIAVGGQPTDRTARLWPHRHCGEGQFVALLRRADDGTDGTVAHERGIGTTGRRARSRRSVPTRSGRVTARDGPDPDQVRAAWAAFAATTMPEAPGGGDCGDSSEITVRGDRAFLLPTTIAAIDDIDLARPGLPLGRLRPGRFEPDAALATSQLAALPMAPDHERSWTERDPELATYLAGGTIEDPGPDGWVLIRYRRWGLGWARRRSGVLKNALPGHLRHQAAAHRRSQHQPRQ